MRPVATLCAALALSLVACGGDADNAPPDGGRAAPTKGGIPPAADPEALLDYANEHFAENEALVDRLSPQGREAFEKLVLIGSGGFEDEELEAAATPAFFLRQDLERLQRETEGGQELAESGPGRLMTQLIRFESRGQWGRAWELLHPAHQEVASRAEYTSCREQEEGTGFTVNSIEVLEIYEEPLDSPGIEVEQAPKVTYRISSDLGSETDTSTAVPVDGEWRWILPAEGYRAYQDGECPI